MNHTYRVCGKRAGLCLILVLLVLFVPAVRLTAYAGNGGLAGANIKDGVLLGYYGDGGDIVIPDTVTMIGPKAFKGNDNVTSVTIPGSVSTIGYHAFDGCSQLKSVKFSDPKDGADLTIRIAAFHDCPKLEEATVPACAKYVTANIFKGCKSLKEIKVHPDNQYYFSQDGVLFGPWVDEGVPQYSDPNLTLIGYPTGSERKEYTIPKKVNKRNVNRIWSGALAKAENLEHITIPQNIKIIGSGAFAASGLKELTIPDTVEDMDVFSTFANCKALREVTFPDSVKEIGMLTFEGCTSLQKVNMDGVRKLGMECFKDCVSLTNMKLPDTLASVEIKVFSGCKNLHRVYMPPSLQTFPSDQYVGVYDVFQNTSSDLLVYVVKGSPGERYAFNNADKFGWSYKVIENESQIDSVSDGNFPLVDMGKKAKLTGAFRLGSSLNVDEVLSGSEYDKFKMAAGDKAVRVYNISISPKESIIPENMELTLGIPKGIKNEDAKLYGLDEGSARELNAIRLSETLKVNINKPGYFAVIGAQENSGGPTGPVLPESVTLNKEKATIKVGELLNLTTTVHPENADDKSITWSSSKESIATVNKGKVEGKSEGTATITATTHNGKSASCTVKVTNGDKIQALKAGIIVGKKKDSRDRAVFGVILEDIYRTSGIELTFTTDSKDVQIKGQKGFELLGIPVKKDEAGVVVYKAVFIYTGENRIFSGVGKHEIAQILAKGDEPKVAIKDISIAGWKQDGNIEFGNVEHIDKNEVVFKKLSPYDFNEDGEVNAEDLKPALKYYCCAEGEEDYNNAKKYDVNKDGIIDIQDFAEIKANYE